jgi:LuxR family maltose regulon positive regulatory protein
MGEAARAGPGPDVASVINPVPANAARLQLAQGDVAAAIRFIHERELDPDDEPRYPHELNHLVLARVLIAEDRPDQAVALLERLLDAAVSQDRAGSVIEIQALRALALAASGQETTAVSCLAEAVSLACPQGYVRVFADESAPMSTLLARLIATQKSDEPTARPVPLGCLAQLLRALGEQPGARAPQQGTAAAVAGLVDPLTPRELEILALVAAGTSNPRIAEDLVVTLDTVKKHVSHVLGKLGAANRTEAVNRARQLGLIP